MTTQELASVAQQLVAAAVDRLAGLAFGARGFGICHGSVPALNPG